MKLHLVIASHSGEPLPAGRPLVVEVRDIEYEDAPAHVLERLRTTIPDNATSVDVTIDVATPTRSAIVWAHVDADADGRVSAGDYITVESYPLPADNQRPLAIRIKPIR